MQIALGLNYKIMKNSKYIPLTDKETIEALENTDNYEIAYRIKELKKEVANFKRKLTKQLKCKR